MRRQLEQLYIADPDLAQKADDLLERKRGNISDDALTLFLDDAVSALAQETEFGHSVVAGYCRLLGEVNDDQITTFHAVVSEAAQKGPEFGRLMAAHSPPVIAAGSGKLWHQYTNTVRIMLTKGAYTLNHPLQALSELLSLKDIPSAESFLNLLSVIYSQDITYNRSLHLTYTVPPAVLSFPARKRSWQTDQFRRVIAADVNLSDAFLEGMQHNVRFLTKDGLDRFVSLGLSLHSDNSSRTRYFSLSSSQGRDACAGFRTSAQFGDARQRFGRYLQARTGKGLSLRQFPQNAFASEPDVMVYSDGVSIYVPEEIGVFETGDRNMSLYQTLIKLESAYYEFDTYQFDLEKAFEGGFTQNSADNRSDLEAFFSAFAQKDLAADLFTIFEHGRIRRLLKRFYPGMLAAVTPFLLQEANRLYSKDCRPSPLNILYARIALDAKQQPIEIVPHEINELFENIVNTFDHDVSKNSSVETGAKLTRRFYPEVEKMMSAPSGSVYAPLKTPFGIKPRPELVYDARRRCEELAAALKQKLKMNGIHLYKSDIRKFLSDHDGNLNRDALKQMIVRFSQDADPDNEAISWEEIDAIFGKSLQTDFIEDAAEGAVFRYKEWDCGIGDYLHGHVRVRERTVQGTGGGFYEETLRKYAGLVRRIRHAFELLKPEGLTLLRRWIEGDEFDYRALLNYALDKKAGATPSERLYLKRVKHHRDVSVLLLADMSKSTANPVPGTDVSVLEVEKEAVVLFCEALTVVGDAFAIAGFSGTGRLGVDYYKIKDFDEPLDQAVRERIQRMSPQRSTRMGAAVRHAAKQFDKIPSKIRILMIISDGFPNDADYKQTYAVEDTRKAIAEARAENIFVKAITVNLSEAARLDEIYGNIHHNVISDVRDLPDRLLRLYSLLTR